MINSQSKMEQFLCSCIIDDEKHCKSNFILKFEKKKIKFNFSSTIDATIDMLSIDSEEIFLAQNSCFKRLKFDGINIFKFDR